ncbi:MAG: PIN domain-containing protein [Candidatus Nanohaloarchaea archaeon]
MQKKILLDTNFLVAPFQFSFDLFEELERLYPYHDLYTLDEAVQEARSIESGKYSELVKQLVEKKDIEVMETEEEGEVDNLLVEISDDYVIATNDKELKKRILERSRPVIIVRQGTHLEVKNRRAENL